MIEERNLNSRSVSNTWLVQITGTAPIWSQLIDRLQCVELMDAHAPQ